MPTSTSTPKTRRAAPKAPAATAKAPIAKPASTPKSAAPQPKKPAVKHVAKGSAPASAKPVKVKLKLVRDSFTMPQTDFELIDVLKQRALGFRHPAKKSELLRAGLQVLADLPPAQLEAALSRIPSLKPGRPKKAD
ncbi:MAG: hypothetical protein V9G29_20125 [Burkholderiaceae bacterium]